MMHQENSIQIYFEKKKDFFALITDTQICFNKLPRKFINEKISQLSAPG